MPNSNKGTPISNLPIENSNNSTSGQTSIVILEVPSNIKISLVDASSLNQFKIWSGLASLLSNFAVGFWVWYGQESNEILNPFIFWVALLCTILCLAFFIISLFSEQKMNQESHEIKYTPH